ncbi:MAG TPA: YdeI/OmpD-associated family protein [Terriglobales bacterium]
MSSELTIVRFSTRKAWRAWLTKHYASSPGIWFTFYKAHTAQRGIAYEDMVREALCFGWIDSLIKRIDDDRYAMKVTPRQTASKWSDLNRKRWAELKTEGLLAAPGLAAAPTSHAYSAKPAIPELPSYIAKRFRHDEKVWEFFQQLAPRERRNFVGWIHTAKRPETRERRIRESMRLLASRKKLGLK